MQLTSVEADHNTIPEGFVLEQNYPNPFNPSTTIKFGFPSGSNVKLKISTHLVKKLLNL